MHARPDFIMKTSLPFACHFPFLTGYYLGAADILQKTQ